MGKVRRVTGPMAVVRGTETILVAEDEAAVRILARKILELHGYRVLTAKDGKHALEMAADHDGPIDLLLTDVVMPRLDGRELADQLQQIRPDVAVLYVSGYSEDRIAHHGVLDENVSFLQKPYTEEILVGRVRSLLGKRS